MGYKALGVAYMVKALRAMNENDRDGYDSLRRKAVQQWNISLGLKPDQPGLLKFVEKYSR